MAEESDQDSKTEEATEKRISDAVEKGNVPFSREAGSTASLFALLLGALILVDYQLRSLATLLGSFVTDPMRWIVDTYADAGTLFFELTLSVFAVLAPLLVFLTAAGILASVVQNPPRIAIERIRPKLSKLSIRQGWKRIFGANGWIEFAKSCVKFTIVGSVCYLALSAEFDNLTTAVFMRPDQLLALINRIVLWLIASVAVTGLVIVVADVLWVRHDWRRNLRMTHQELKDEMKDADGDPLVKMRFRSLARDRLRRQMISAVPTATMIVTNPTHFAVALRYIRNQDEAPVVIAKGMDLIALKIREIARDHNIPILEDKPLARSLYDNVQIDQIIPPEFYQAVAGLISHLENSAPHHTARL